MWATAACRSQTRATVPRHTDYKLRRWVNSYGSFHSVLEGHQRWHCTWSSLLWLLNLSLRLSATIKLRWDMTLAKKSERHNKAVCVAVQRSTLSELRRAPISCFLNELNGHCCYRFEICFTLLNCIRLFERLVSSVVPSHPVRQPHYAPDRMLTIDHGSGLKRPYTGLSFACFIPHWDVSQVNDTIHFCYLFRVKSVHFSLLTVHFLRQHEDNHGPPAVPATESSSISSRDKELVVREREFRLIKGLELYCKFKMSVGQYDALVYCWAPCRADIHKLPER